MKQFPVTRFETVHLRETMPLCWALTVPPCVSLRHGRVYAAENINGQGPPDITGWPREKPGQWGAEQVR